MNALAATIAALFAAVSALPSALRLTDELPVSRPKLVSDADADADDIVVLLLDGYPRHDAMDEMVDSDNQKFLRALETRGFEVARRSRSNYTATWSTLASMAHGGYLDEIDALRTPYPDDAAGQYRALMRAITLAPALDPLRQRGYEVIAVPPKVEGAELGAADRFLRPAAMSAFEISLIQRTTLGAVVFYLGQTWPSMRIDTESRRVASSW